MRDLDLPQVSSPYKTLVEKLTNLSFIPSLAETHALYIPNAESLKLLRNCQKCYSKKCFIVNATLTTMGFKQLGGLENLQIFFCFFGKYMTEK